MSIIPEGVLLFIAKAAAVIAGQVFLATGSQRTLAELFIFLSSSVTKYL